MIDLYKNSNPFYPKKSMIRYLKKNIKYIIDYSEKYVSIPVNSYFSKFNISPENIIITNGTMEAMDLILQTNHLKKIGYFYPTFWGIKIASQKNNYKCLEEKIDNFITYDYKDIDKLAKKVDVLYLCNYNNPTLNFIDNDKLYEIISNNKECVFIVDEAVLVFDSEYENKTMLNYINQTSNLNVLISCSKIFGICGLRTGLLFSCNDCCTKYRNNQMPFSTNKLSSIFIKKYINEFSRLEKSKIKIKRNFNYLINEINNSLKILVSEYYYNNSSFVLLQLQSDINIDEIEKILLKNKIKVSFINKCYNLPSNYIRISAGKKNEFKKLIKILKKYIKKLGEKNGKCIY